jgi:hypothetical protein
MTVGADSRLPASVINKLNRLSEQAIIKLSLLPRCRGEAPLSDEPR